MTRDTTVGRRKELKVLGVLGCRRWLVALVVVRHGSPMWEECGSDDRRARICGSLEELLDSGRREGDWVNQRPSCCRNGGMLPGEEG